jgi:hypothetical protein
MLVALSVISQTNEWHTDYVTLDDDANGTGYNTSSVAVIGPNRFVALVTQTPATPVLDNLFSPPGNYLVGYWDADSVMGRVPSPIGGQQTAPQYGTGGQYTLWEYLLDQVQFEGAWQIAADNNGYIYVANNDVSHNILVFNLTETGLESTENRLETGDQNIWGIDVDTSGYVFVVDYEGNDVKTAEVRVYAGIDDPTTNWKTFGGHVDPPVSTIDLPTGIYQGIGVSGDGTAIYISATTERSVWRYTGDPVGGYTLDNGFSYTMAEDDTVNDGGLGTPSTLGLAYLDEPPLVFAVADTFLGIGTDGGYPYGRIYVLHPTEGTPLDTIDIAAWNLAITGAYNTGSSNGRAGGFASVLDVDVEPTQPGIYTQTFYGWAAEKWLFDGQLPAVGIEKISDQIPQAFLLKQNYPNPFNPETTIEFTIQKTELVTLDVFNTVGQKVGALINEKMSPGTFQVTFNAGHLPSGVYFYRIKAGTHTDIKKMTLLK